ncbi:hypothetical protein GCM10023196_031160 [Actinoallomurus vinaceus]|uniref:Uncharacterized protein n=1 Tax=Actinoallomurus vinaceus TaxID=1080074 RepID=A0ABP8UBD2_9ACTN
MRLRTAAVSAGLAIVAVAGLSAPAQAADWKAVARYNSQSQCIDAGQQYHREGWAYMCTHDGGAPPYILWIKPI